MSYYRKNKWGDNIEVESYTCGACKNFDFETVRDSGSTSDCIIHTDKAHSDLPLNESPCIDYKMANDVYSF